MARGAIEQSAAKTWWWVAPAALVLVATWIIWLNPVGFGEGEAGGLSHRLRPYPFVSSEVETRLEGPSTSLGTNGYGGAS